MDVNNRQSSAFSQSPLRDPNPNTGVQATIQEGLTVQLIAAPFFKRSLAYVVDLAVIGTGLYVLVAVLGILAAIAVPTILIAVKSGNTAGGFAGLFGIIFVVFLLLMAAMIFYDGYFVYFEHRYGATPGKKIFGLKVVSLDAARLTWGQCILRELLRYIDCGLVIPGAISFFTTSKNQRLGDLAAGTMIVHSAQKESRTNYMYVKQEQYHLLLETLQPKPISKELCEHYLTFAYQRYIAKKSNEGAAGLARWEQRVRLFLPAASELDLDQETIFLFFAEYCFQTTNRTP